MQRFTFPLKISMIEDGTYEIFSNPSQSKNSKLQYNGKYIEYDKWERLYKYRSIKKWYPGGVKRNDSPEYTTETFITCRKKLSDYANGLSIYPNDLNEDYEINIKEITTSKWTREEVHYYTIIPFNQREPKITKSTSEKTINNQTIKPDIEEDLDIAVKPKQISKNHFGNIQFSTNVLHSDSIDLTLVLKKLYPGNYSNDIEGSYTAWISPEIPKCHFDSISEFMDFSGRFPYDKGNYTIVSGMKSYKLKGNEYCVITFSTSDCYPTRNYTTPGILGVALFIKKALKWELVNFDPFIAALGSYQYAGTIDKIIELDNNTVGYCMFFVDGGHGLDLSHNTLQLFTFNEEKYKHLLTFNYFDFKLIPDNHQSPILECNSKIKINKDSIIIMRHGSVNQIFLSELEDPSVYGLDGICKEISEIKEYSRIKKKFNFDNENKYVFKNSKYRLIQSTFKSEIQQYGEKTYKSIGFSGTEIISNLEIPNQRKEEELRVAIVAEQERKAGEINNRAKNAFSSIGMSDGSANDDEYILASGVKNKLPFFLDGRTAIYLPKPYYPGNNEATLIIKITVNKNGDVTKVDADASKSNTSYPELVEAAIKAAKQAKFNVDNNAPEAQTGTITYRFVLD